MLLPKKLTFQLTPLLDLLLIVIFAQYMEMQQTSAKAEKEVSQRAEEKTAEAEDAKKKAEERERQAAKKLEELENQSDSALSELKKKLSEKSEELDRELASREEVKKLIAKFFAIDKEKLDKLLAADTNRKEQEKQELQKLQKQLADAAKNEAIKHLLTHDAMRKQVDVWEVFVDEERIVRLKAGQEDRSFRVNMMTYEDFNKARERLPNKEKVAFYQQENSKAVKDVANKLANSINTLPAPKSIVVLLVSWKVRSHYSDPAVDGLKLFVQQSKSGSNRTTYVLAIIGHKEKP